jgi:NitT/TauT family transport system permease protein/taurine transport system permease protein
MSVILERPASWRETGGDELDLADDRSERRRATARRVAIGASGLLGLLLAWQVASAIWHDGIILPSPIRTASTFVHYLSHPYPSNGVTLWQDLLISLRRILIGFTGGVTIGTVIGAAMFSSRRVRHLVDPLIEATRPLPPLAFIPLLIVWFGIGELPKELLIVTGMIPIMVISTVAALDEVPEDLQLSARTLGATRLYTLWHVQIRAALPAIITGMRLSMGGAWSSIVAAEMVAATSGVGYVIMLAGNYLNTAVVFSGILTIGLTGFALDAVLRGLLRLADPSRAR